jgi:hypothetical protein
MADTTIGGIKVKIGADTTGFETGLAKTRKGINQVGKWAAAASAAAVIAGAAIVNSQRKVLDSLAKTSDALGIQQEKLQALQHIGELTGTSNEMVNRSLERMQRNLGAAARTGGASADALEDLGVNVKEIINLSPDKQMEVLAKALSGVETQALKASIANDIFGRNGTRMLKMLDQLKNEGLDPTVDSIEKMGVALTRVDTSKVENANDALFKAEQVTTGLANKLTVKLSPILEEIANQFIGAATESDGFSNSVDSAFDGAIDIIGVFADGLHGIDIIISSLGVAFDGVGVGIITVFNEVDKALDKFVLQASKDINSLIDIVNNIPGIDIEKILIDESGGKSFLQSTLDNAEANLDESFARIQEKLLEPLPSEALKQWVDDVEEAATRASEILVGNEDTDVNKLDLLIEEQAAMTAAEQEAADARVRIAQAEAAAKKQAQGQFFNDLASLMNTGSKKAFKIGKAAAIANASIKGVSSAVAAWDAGMSTGGPWAPVVAAAYAGASLAKTGAMISTISSQSFGAPSSPTSFSGGLPTVNTSGAATQQAPNNVSIDIVGSEGATFSRDAVIGLIGQINDATSDGVTLNTGG